VENKDRYPIFKNLSNKVTIKEKGNVEIILKAEDPDNEEVTFSAENIPEGASFVGNKFTWQTDYDTVQKDNVVKKAISKYHLLRKSFVVTFVAKSNELIIKKDVIVTVTDINRAPVLGDLKDITINEGEVLNLEPVATDPDGDRIAYYYSGWVNRNKYQSTYGDAGTHFVTVTASDSFLTDSKDVKIIVNNVNRAPTILVKDQKVNEGETLSFEVDASDPEGDDVNISLLSLLSDASFKDNIFTWTPDFDVTEEKAYVNLTFRAKDSQTTTTKNVIITISNVNRVPEVYNVSPSAEITIYEGSSVRFDVLAKDDDNDELTYEWPFSLINKYSGSPSLVRQFTTAGKKEVKVVVSDGKDSVVHIWKVNVIKKPVVKAPVVKKEPVVEKPVQKPLDQMTPEELIELYGKYTVTEEGGRVVSVTKKTIEVRK